MTDTEIRALIAESEARHAAKLDALTSLLECSLRGSGIEIVSAEEARAILSPPAGAREVSMNAPAPKTAPQETAMFTPIRDHTAAIEVRKAESAGQFTLNDRAVFSSRADWGPSVLRAGTVTQIVKSGASVFLTIRSDEGAEFTRHACDVQPVTRWQDRVDPAVAAAVYDGDGPLPVLLHPENPPGPAVSAYWMYGEVLVVGIYPDETHGTVYRWDSGLDAAPTVIHWEAPHCADDGCGSPCEHRSA